MSERGEQEKYFSAWTEKFQISFPSGHVMFIYYINTYEVTIYLTFGPKGVIYCYRSNMIFLHVTVTCYFHV